MMYQYLELSLSKHCYFQYSLGLLLPYRASANINQALSPERDVLKNELKDEIKATFLQISEGYANILRLKYVQGLKTSTIAKLLKTSIKAVEGKLKRAKIKFQENWTYDRKAKKKFVEVDNVSRD